tara:strand:+ start:1835 stop:2242 length:408 start_codon:yes stop_codon:yes gene_type:complete
MSQKIEEINALWVALNFIFPKHQQEGESYVSKSVKFKVFINEEIVGEVTKEDPRTFMSNMKFGSKVDILKGNMDLGEVSSSFSWIVGSDKATLHLDSEKSKVVNMNFANQNRVEIWDERDWDLIDEDGNLIEKDN